jgi:hypothetical protein
MRVVNTTGLCIYCGSVMMGRRSDGVYCTDTCRTKGNRIIRREEETGGPMDSLAAVVASGILLGEPVKAGVIKRNKRKEVKDETGA